MLRRRVGGVMLRECCRGCWALCVRGGAGGFLHNDV